MAEHGQVRFANTTPLDYAAVLVPFGGDKLVVNGTERTIPLWGLPFDIRDCFKNKIANQSLAQNTFYYVYACDIGGNLVLNAETNGHVTGTGGIEVCYTDSTQTVVGCIYTLHGKIAPTYKNMLLGTWFNRYETGLFVDPYSYTSSTSWFEPNSNNRIGMVVWADEAPLIVAAFTLGSYISGATAYAGVGVNRQNEADGYACFKSSQSEDIAAVGPVVPFAAHAEGYHYLSCLLKSGGGGNSVSFQTGSRLVCAWRG